MAGYPLCPHMQDGVLLLFPRHAAPWLESQSLALLVEHRSQLAGAGELSSTKAKPHFPPTLICAEIIWGGGLCLGWPSPHPESPHPGGWHASEKPVIA